MPNNKYYWLRLKKDFFTHRAIKKLRNIAGGDTYTIIYLKMQLLTLQDNGVFYYEGIEDDFAEEIALTIDERVDDVRVTIAFLMKCGLLVQKSETELFLPEVPTLVGSEGESAERMRNLRQRERERASLCDNVVRTSDTEKERDIEKEIEKKRLEKESKPKKDSQSQEALFENLISDYQISEPVIEKLKDFLAYKREIKDTYKAERGMKSLLTKVATAEQSYGASKVISCIDDTMANGWKGLFFDRLGKKGGSSPQRISGDFFDEAIRELRENGDQWKGEI